VVVRRAGLAPLRRQWPGSADGLTAVVPLCGLTEPADEPTLGE
jgi:hypothetical protein